VSGRGMVLSARCGAGDQAVHRDVQRCVSEDRYNRCKNMVAYDRSQSQSFCLVHPPPPPPPPLVAKATTTFEQCARCAVTYGRRCLRKVAKTNPTFPYCHAHIHQRPPVKKVHWKETLVEPSPVPVDVRPVVEEEPIVQHRASAPLQPAVAPLQATPAPIKQKHSEQPSEPSVLFLAMVLILLGVLCSGSPTTFGGRALHTPHGGDTQLDGGHRLLHRHLDGGHQHLHRHRLREVCSPFAGVT
jgi:hypothetical protein